MAASNTSSPSGQAIVFSLAGVDIGQVLRDGQVVNLNDPNQRSLAYGQKFTWIKPAAKRSRLQTSSSTKSPSAARFADLRV